MVPPLASLGWAQRSPTFAAKGAAKMEHPAFVLMLARSLLLRFAQRRDDVMDNGGSGLAEC
jgi:hypothetical protein